MLYKKVLPAAPTKILLKYVLAPSYFFPLLKIRNEIVAFLSLNSVIFTCMGGETVFNVLLSPIKVEKVKTPLLYFEKIMDLF